MKNSAVLCLLIFCLSACSTPSSLLLPEQSVLDERRIELHDISQLPAPMTRIMNGDTLRIVRDAQTPAEKDEMVLFFVRPDGSFSYPFVGLIQAAQRSPEEVAEEISGKLAAIYRYPKVTVNIAIAPGNRVFVGGAVRNPSAFELTAAASIEQAIIGAGGVLPTADSEHIALLRMDAAGLYQVYFTDFSQFLQAKPQRRGVMLQRGDIVFVPKSALGNAIEGVDLYFNQLIPFSKGIGIGFSYDLNKSTGSSTTVTLP
ncbi:polysaccharide biosynthesis/export family protein [Iodobacter sp. LRB]|uniref:polysaccharide biosynthesis/export family protein n=1 Tax=unclassified Iodobacter TaxID=235634 RepID=UPI000C1145D5|nr:polysaccharide biosynthesis/export family protein [Iodobacter sp. BJB302]PHU99862.1 sugar ABC transporter substrate-binding protein [Iodobacter sp. BJB302]